MSAMMRLQKILANAGISSRRDAELLVKSGRVTVNGVVVTELGSSADPLKDKVAFDGERVKPETPVYMLLHKPRGVVSTLEDPEGRPTIADYMPKTPMRMYPVGRLDFDASGLIFLTNDGDLAQALLHPSKKVHKTYLVKVRGTPEESVLEKLRKGVYIDRGIKTMPCKVVFEEVRMHGRKVTENTWLKFFIHEGRNRQIKKMCATTGHLALRIHRVAIGPLSLGTMPAGTWRYCTPEEIAALKEIKRKAALAPKAPKKRSSSRSRSGGRSGPARNNERSDRTRNRRERRP